MISINSSFHIMSVFAFVFLCWQIIKLQNNFRIATKVHTKARILLKFNDFIKVLCKIYNIPLVEKSTLNKVLKIAPKPWLTMVNNNKIDKIFISANPKPSCLIYLNKDKISGKEEQDLMDSLSGDIEVKFVPNQGE